MFLCVFGLIFSLLGFDFSFGRGNATTFPFLSNKVSSDPFCPPIPLLISLDPCWLVNFCSLGLIPFLSDVNKATCDCFDFSKLFGSGSIKVNCDLPDPTVTSHLQSGQVSMVKQSMADLPFSDMSESDLPPARENKTLFSSLGLFLPNVNIPDRLVSSEKLAGHLFSVKIDFDCFDPIKTLWSLLENWIDRIFLLGSSRVNSDPTDRSPPSE